MKNKSQQQNPIKFNKERSSIKSKQFNGVNNFVDTTLPGEKITLDIVIQL